jgi:hypothetical protein
MTLQAHVDLVVDDLLESLPKGEGLGPGERRGIIARYTAVLEANFISWMTAAYLAVSSEAARGIIEENLREEVRDNHPGMLRRFAMAAQAVPTDADALAVHRRLEDVRRFVARLSAANLVLMMAFFERFITRFMPYLADLARRQGSAEQEYTDVHGVVDIEHTEQLFRALEAETMFGRTPLAGTTNLFDGVEVLRALIERVIHRGVDEDPLLEARIATGIGAW